MTDEHDKKSSVDESSAPSESAAPAGSAPAPAAAHRPASDTDPLAELIRMVKEEDPFADVLARKPGPLTQRATPKAEGASPAPDEARQPAVPPAPEAPRGTPVPPGETRAAPRPFAAESRPDSASARFMTPQESKQTAKPVAPPSMPPASSDDVLAKRQEEPEQGFAGRAARDSSGLSLGLRRGDTEDTGPKDDGNRSGRISHDAGVPKSAGKDIEPPAEPVVPPAAGAEPSAEDAPARLRSWMKPSGGTRKAATTEDASPAPAHRATTEFTPPAPEPVSAPEPPADEPYEAPALDPVDLERALRDFRDAPEHVLRADSGWHDDGFDDEYGPDDDLNRAGDPGGEAPAAPPPSYSAAPEPSVPVPPYASAPHDEPEFSAAPPAEAAGDAQGGFDPVDPYDDPAFEDFDAEDYGTEATEAPYRGAPAEPYLSEEAIEEAVDERVDGQGTLRQAAAFEHAAQHEPKPRRRGTFFAVGILLGLVVLGGGFAYVMSGETAPADGEAPILRANNAPAKIEPDDPGGANIPNQNRLVFDRVSGEASGGEEQIVSREEEIIEPAGATKQAGRMGESDSADSGTIKTPSDVADAPATTPQASGQQAALSPNGSSAGLPLAPVPRRVKTMVVRPDGSIVAAEEPAPTRSASESEAAPTPAPAAPAPAPVASTAASEPDPGEKTAERAVSALNSGAVPAPPSRPESAPEPVDSASSGTASSVTPVRPVRGAPMQLNPNPVTRQTANGGSSAATTPEPEPAPATSSSASRQVASATPSAAPAPSSSGEYVVQLAARKNEEQAQGAYNALKAKYGKVLGRYQPLIQRADLGDRGVYYRVRVGPMASADAATEVCNQLKAAGLSDCLVRQR